MAEKKQKDIFAEIIDKHGAGSIIQASSKPSYTGDSIKTGSYALDKALGCGGWPTGRIVELYGPESSGKTTMCLHAVANAQAKGLKVAYIDAEHALDLEYAANLGVDLDSLFITQPDNGEQALDVAKMLVTPGSGVSLVVVDSVAALVPKAEIEGDVGDHHVGRQARMMGQSLRMMTPLAARSGALVMFVNQIRMKVGVMYGSPETTTGGNALKYYSSVRLDVRRIGALKEGQSFVGNRTRAKVVKNKLAPPFQIAEFDIVYGKGIDRNAELVDACLDKEVLVRAGAWFNLKGSDLKWQGRQAVITAIGEDSGLATKLSEAAGL